MQRVTVTSSDITSIGYEPHTQILEIEFKKGDLYHYFNVPENIYSDLMQANSHGKFFSQYIKERFRYQKI